MAQKRSYRDFTYKEAVFRICCDKFEAVTAEILRQRRILEDYIERHGDTLFTEKHIAGILRASTIKRCPRRFQLTTITCLTL